MKSPGRLPSPPVGGIAVFVLALAVYIPLSCYDLSMLDEGALLYVAERLTRGDVLYRDIVTGIMPGVYYLQGLLFEVFGYSVMTGRVLAGATLAINSALVYALATGFLKKWTSLIIALLFTAMALPAYRWPGYSQTSMTFVLLALYLFIRYLGSSRRMALVTSGVAAGMALVFKQNYGVFITAALGIILLARLAARKEWRPVIVFSIAFLSPLIIVVLYFHAMGGLGQMVEYTFISLFRKAAAAYYKPYPLLSGTGPFFFTTEPYNFIPFRDLAIWTLKEGLARRVWVLGAVVLIYILPLIVIASSVLHTAISIIRRRANWEEAALVLASVLLFLGVFPRSDIHHLTFVLPPLMVTGGLMARRLPLPAGVIPPSRAVAFALIALFSMLCIASAYLPLFVPAPGEEKTPLLVQRARGISTGRNGAAVIRAVTGFIRKNTAPDEPVLVVPTGAMYYFLTGRKSAVPYPLIMPGAMDEGAVIRAMEEKGLKHIIYSDMSFDGKTLGHHMPRIHGYIIRNYHIDPAYPLQEVGGGTYVLKRGAVREELIPLDGEARAALRERGGHWPGRGADAPLYDFIEEFPRARSGVVLGSGRAAPLFRSNQVLHNAWLLKDAIMQMPGRGWSKVYTSFAVHIPMGSALRFSIGESPVVWHREFGDGALFEVFLYDRGTKRLVRVFSRYLDPKDRVEERRWFTYLVGLKKYEGRDLIIYFVTSGGPRLNLTMGGMNRWRQVDMAGWGDPALVSLENRRGSGAVAETAEVTAAAEAKAGTGKEAPMPRRVAREMARFEDISFILDEERRHPGDYDVHLTLGRIYERQGRTHEAEEELRAALKAYPGGTGAISLLARHLMRAGRTGEARGLLERGLDKAPNDGRLNMAMGDLSRRTNEYGRAMAAYRRVIRGHPRNMAARMGLARAYLEDKKTDEAISEAENILKRNPRNLPAIILLGDAYRFKKEWKRAEDTYRKALAMARGPGGAGRGIAGLRLAMALREMGREAEALVALRRVLSEPGASDEVRKRAQEEISSMEKAGQRER